MTAADEEQQKRMLEGLPNYALIAYGRDFVNPGSAHDRGASEIAPLYVDIGALFAAGLPEGPQPTLLRRDDGACIFYAGQVNTLFGEPETGKTWIALAAIAEALMSDGTALIVDLDHNGAAATIIRLQAFGVPASILADSARVRFAEPEDAEHLDRIVADARNRPPTLAILDSIGELMPLLGLGSNSPDDFTSAHRRVLKPLAAAGAAVIGIDHVAKNPTSKNQGPTGTAAKKRAIGGAALRVELVEAFAPGRGGAARISINKDRHGGLRRHCPAAGSGEPVVGRFQLTDVDGALSWVITATGGAVLSEDDRLAKDIAALDQMVPPPRSQREVKARMKWGGDRAATAMRGWLDLRSAGTPAERGTGSADGVPRSSTPVSQSEEPAVPPGIAELASPPQITEPANPPALRLAATDLDRGLCRRPCPKHPGTPTNTSNGRCPDCISGLPARQQ